MTSRCKGSHGGARQRAGRRRLHVAAYHQVRLSTNMYREWNQLKEKLKLLSFDAVAAFLNHHKNAFRRVIVTYLESGRISRACV